MDDAPLKIGIAGLGTVGAAVFRLLEDNGALIAARLQRPVRVTAVSARSRKDRGLDLSKVKWHDDPAALADDENVDLVVELIGGAEGAAFDLVRKSLGNGKPVVTANKALLAARGGEILRLLENGPENGKRTLSYEAAVAGGIPVIKALREGLVANEINAVYGILNGTCNFILSQMRGTGGKFGDVLKEAQAKGYAEADPSFDIDGIDAAHKLSILSGLAFGCVPDPASVRTQGIRDITGVDIAFADELGYRIKLLGIARRTARGIEQSVEPCLVPKNIPMAHIEGVENAVYIDGGHAGKILLTGAGAGGSATASAVVADIIDAARGGAGLPLFGRADPQTMQTADTAARTGSYFLRLTVLDQPGVIADVSAILRDCRVSLESILQRGRAPNQPVPVILTSHETLEGDMLKAAEKIGRLGSSVEPPHLMRIETFERDPLQ
ncbi:MAG: homoserine dehydrogenase [Alphaproteobacteria bacterium]|nr:homoserine dehydrogenase [Alphaproteobacteria bacterium]MDE2335905.1 homoserine dehydrogenase [Alphaproteobacteria bacterium]